ncbi:unnamed protein product [Thlaspi arvense]|uniref:Uncharacterized protein n=1 Tax=Thlaspi arvense TaxID=13288 RepID=A0AAU9RZA0_THLAR|nr:unnamed protein product [Thlaspi arvense]
MDSTPSKPYTWMNEGSSSIFGGRAKSVWRRHGTMGDAKRKSETEMENAEKKIARDEARTSRFEELRDDLFREAANLVAEDPSTRIAILITPPASAPDDSIHSFGYPSVQGFKHQLVFLPSSIFHFLCCYENACVVYTTV